MTLEYRGQVILMVGAKEVEALHDELVEIVNLCEEVGVGCAKTLELCAKLGVVLR